MKITKKLQILAFVALSSCGLTTLVSGAESRVYIRFDPAGKGAVTAAVTAAGGRVHYEFDALNAIAASLPEEALAGLGRNAAVRGVEPDPERHLLADTEPYGVAMVGAPAAILAGGDGTGITVGVIDSGVYTGHADFSGVTIDGYPKERVTQTRVKGKVTTVIVPLTADDEEFWARDHLGHGTHVTGTIGAAANGFGVVGVSPGKVKIFMVKVFGDTGNWVYSSTLLDAAQKAKQGGARIISMSLGGGAPSTTERDGLALLYSQNTLLVAAAGNDGTTSMSYPASYDSVISVAAIDAAKVVADFSQKNSEVELAAPGVAVLSTVPFVNSASVTVGAATFNGDPLEFAATGSANGILVDGGLAESVNSAWSGMIVLVQRGSISFYDKVMNVQNSGGLAAVIYNNVPGELLGTLGAGNTSLIPAIGLSDTDGAALLELLGQSATVTNTQTIPGSGYEAWSGTSMATPHVSGAAALIWSKYPTATAAQVRQALTSTAEDLGAAGRDTAYGYGLVRADFALAELAVIVGSGGSGDTKSPVITEVRSRVTNAKRGSFEITWTTDEPATSSVSLTGYGTYSDTALVKAHRMTFNGTKGATYSYTVSSTDASGNISTAGPYLHQN